jgi:hypothetical protein
MSFQGHIHNGVVVFDEPAALPEGTKVRVEPLNAGAGVVIRPGTGDWEAAARAAQELRDTGYDFDAACFADAAPAKPLDSATKEALRSLLTQEQFDALVDVVDSGGPDVALLLKLRRASMA